MTWIKKHDHRYRSSDMRCVECDLLFGDSEPPPVPKPITYEELFQFVVDHGFNDYWCLGCADQHSEDCLVKRVLDVRAEQHKNEAQK